MLSLNRVYPQVQTKKRGDQPVVGKAKQLRLHQQPDNKHKRNDCTKEWPVTNNRKEASAFKRLH